MAILLVSFSLKVFGQAFFKRLVGSKGNALGVFLSLHSSASVAAGEFFDFLHRDMVAISFDGVL